MALRFEHDHIIIKLGDQKPNFSENNIKEMDHISFGLIEFILIKLIPQVSKQVDNIPQVESNMLTEYLLHSNLFPIGFGQIGIKSHDLHKDARVLLDCSHDSY
jgi:hypothetical protein